MSENNHSHHDVFSQSDHSYEQGSSQQILVYFARNTYPLEGAYIQNNTIKGSFGQAQIQQAQKQKLILYEQDNFRVIDSISRLIVVKSALNQNKKQSIQPLQKGTNHIVDQPVEKQKIQSRRQNGVTQEKQQKMQEEIFFSSESESNKSEDPPIVARKRSKQSKITKQQRTISKHILKKKLKYLHKLKEEGEKKQ